MVLTMKLAQISLLFSLILPVAVIAGTAYTWVDKNGVLHISELPPETQVETTKKIRLPYRDTAAPAPEYLQPKTIEDLPDNFNLDALEALAHSEPSSHTPQTTNNNAQQTPPTAGEQAETLEIAIDTPSNQQSIHSNSGLITVALEANRDLLVGESYQLLFNDHRYGAPQHVPFWEMKDIDRGSHTIKVIATESGKIIASTRTITVHLHRGRVK